MTLGKILPYKTGSAGAKTLAAALGIKRLRLKNSKWKPKTGSFVINWGSSDYGPLKEYLGSTDHMFNMLNPPLKVREAVDKKKFFVKMMEKYNGKEQDDWLTPLFWLDAQSIPGDCYPVVCRTVLNGHSGAGIVIADGPNDVVPAPLYVQYVKKKKEFRIHVGKLPNGEFTIIAEQQKVRKTGQEPLDWRIRNHANGFIFQRQGITVPSVVRDAAIKCLKATDLDFGAIDIIYTSAGKAFVLEVNTAPGLEGQTVEDYVNFFKELL